MPKKTLRDLGDKIARGSRTDVESKIADVRAALDTDDLERIKSSREALQQSFYKISEQIYSAMGTDGGAGAAPTTDGARNPQRGDDVVDGEYNEKPQFGWPRP